MNLNDDRIKTRMEHMQDNPDKPYSIKYSVEFGNFAADDIKDMPRTGLTQDLLMISCITQPNGSYSQNWATYDGMTQKAMHHDDVFKAWIMMAAKLREKEDLHELGRLLCHQTFEIWAEEVMKMKKVIVPPTPTLIM